MSTIRRVLDRIQAAHDAATPAPWFLLWDEETREEDGDPIAVGVPDPHTGHMEPIVMLDDVRVAEYEEAPADLRLVEEARNALPLFLRIACAAHTYVSGPGSVELAELTAALDGLVILAHEEPTL